jgi:hypothetical protein
MPEENGEGFGNRPDEKAAARQVENSKQVPKAIQAGATLAGGALGGLAGLASMGMEGSNQEEAQNPMAGAQQVPSQSALRDEEHPIQMPNKINAKQQALQQFNQHQASQQLRKMQQGNKPQQQQQQQQNDPLFKALLIGDVIAVSQIAKVDQQTAYKLIHNFNQKFGQEQMQQPQHQSPQQAPQQGGQGQQALMSILQKIQQQRGR